MSPVFLPILALLILFIGLPWLVLHYATRMKEARSLDPADEKMLEDLWLTAHEMRQRIATIENILDLQEKQQDQKEKTDD